MSSSLLALLVLLFPAFGAAVLAGRGWRLPRIFTVIVGWAMVGLSSYLLIGFWYQRHSAVVAARKAFVMNVIGDVGMILGTFVLFTQFRSVTYGGVFSHIGSCNP